MGFGYREEIVGFHFLIVKPQRAAEYSTRAASIHT